MATLSKTPRVTTVTLASASAGPFDFTFRLFDADEVTVYVNYLPRTDWTLNATFVDGFTDDATITFDTALSAADVVTILPDLTPWRESDLINGPSLTARLNTELARLWSTAADIKRDTQRAARFFGEVEPVQMTAGRALIANSDATGLEMGPTADEIASAQTYAAAAAESAATAVEILAGARNVFPSMVDLMASDEPFIGQILQTAGYERPGDQGHGFYEIVASGTGTDDGGSYIDLPGSGFQAKLLHGAIVWAEQFGVVLDANGLMQERSAEFNAAFQYAASLADTYDGDDAEDVESIVTGGYEFFCATDFKAKDTLNLMEGASSAARAMTINWSGHVVAVAGGTLEDHTHERPIPLVHFRLRNCKVYWPRLECEMLCAGIKGKVDLANQHYNLELRGFHRYGLWVVANNDSTWWDPIIKQFVRNPEWIRNGVDTTDWAEWNADCIIVTTKDRRFYGGQVGWGGPAARITDTMPDDVDQRIPGQNCYWCGLSASQGYVDGDNGGGDVVFNDLHMMQGLSNDAFPDAGIEPRYGVYADYDLSSGNMVFREVDSPIGVLSFCKVANLSKFDQIDNDQCVHLLFGAQIEMEGELTGSQAAPLSASTATGTLLDPRIRVFASRGGGGAQRYPFMSSMAHQRQMTIGFYDNPSEIYWNGSALVEASTSWNGDFDEWNRLNRASGSYAGQVQYRGRRATAGAWAPSVNAAGDYWVIHNAVTVNPGSVDAADGQILYALTASPASAGDWLVVDADSAPVRQTSRWETNVRPDLYNLWPASNVANYAQINNHSGDEVFTTKTVVDGAAATEELDGGSGTLTFTAPTVRVTGEGASGWDATGDGSLRPEGDGTQDLGDLTHWVRAVFDATGDKRPDHYGENDEPGVTGMAIPVLDWLAALTDRNYSLGSTTRTHPDIRSPVTLDISGDGAPMFRMRDVDDVTLIPRNVSYTGTAFAVIVNGATDGFRIKDGFVQTEAFAVTIKPAASTGGWAENGVVSGMLLEGSATTAKTALSFDGDTRNVATIGNIVKNFQRSGDSGDGLAFAVSGDENDVPVNDDENIVFGFNVVDGVAGPMFHSEDNTRRIAFTFSVGRNVDRAVQIINNYVPYLHNYIGIMAAGPADEFFRSTGTGSSKDMNLAFNLWDGAGVTATEDYAVTLGQAATKNINLIGNIYHDIDQAVGAFHSNAEGPLNFIAEIFDTITGPCMTLAADAVQASIGNCIFNGGTYGIIGSSTARTSPATRRGILVQSTNRFEGVSTDIVQKSQSANLIGDKAATTPALDSQTASDTILFVAPRKGWLTGVTLSFPDAGGNGTTASTFTVYATNSGGSTKLIDATVTKDASQYDTEFWGSEHAQIEVNKFAAGDIIRVVCDGAEDAQTLFQIGLDWFEYDD